MNLQTSSLRAKEKRSKNIIEQEPADNNFPYHNNKIRHLLSSWLGLSFFRYSELNTLNLSKFMKYYENRLNIVKKYNQNIDYFEESIKI